MLAGDAVLRDIEITESSTTSDLVQVFGRGGGPVRIGLDRVTVTDNTSYTALFAEDGRQEFELAMRDVELDRNNTWIDSVLVMGEDGDDTTTIEDSRFYRNDSQTGGVFVNLDMEVAFSNTDFGLGNLDNYVSDIPGCGGEFGIVNGVIPFGEFCPR